MTAHNISCAKLKEKMNRNLKEMKILYETDELALGNIYEDTYLIKKETGEELLHDDFYGDPNCGLIGQNNDWAIIGGEHLTIWTKSKTIKFDTTQLKWIHSIRSKDIHHIELLTDPWSEDSAIWEISIGTWQLKKLRNFEDYRHAEFTEDVKW